MPGADEGAFERFIASALATILTIIFSWQIIIDVYDDSKRRRHLDVTPPSPSTSSSPYVAFSHAEDKQTHDNSASNQNIVTTKAYVTSSPPIVTSKQGRQNKPNSYVKEYRLTPGTISRLEAVPDPIELVTHSARIVNNNRHSAGSPGKIIPGTREGSLGTCGGSEKCGTIPVLSDRTVPEIDSLDTKPSNRDIVRVLNARKYLASPDDFDLDTDSNSSCSPLTVSADILNCDKNELSVIPGTKTSPKIVRKKVKMFEESWDMDSEDGDFREIYGEEDSDRQNPRDFFFMPVEYDSDDEEGYWPRRMLEAISEEDEDDISSEYESESEEEHFSDDSLNVQKQEDDDNDEKSSLKDQNLNNLKRWSSQTGIIEDYLDGSENSVTKTSCLDNSVLENSSSNCNGFSKDSYLDLSVGSPRGDVVSSAALIDGCYGNDAAGSLDGTEKMEVSSNQQNFSLLSPGSGSYSSDRSSPLNEQTRQLCTSLEGLNMLDPSLSSQSDTGIISRTYYKDSSSPISMETKLYNTTNDSINISNFDDSKLEFLDESYKDSELSDCSKPVPRGFIFSRTEEVETKAEIVSKDFVDREVSVHPARAGVHNNQVPGQQLLSSRPAPEIYAVENQNGGEQCVLDTTSDNNDSNLSSNVSFQTITTESVYVIDLDNSFVKNSVDSKFQNQDRSIDSQENIRDGIREVKSEVVQNSERVVPEPKVGISGENSSGDDSSTTTGDTAILNLENREVTDDDASEISEIDIDVINELSKVATENFGGVKSHKVTDLDASSSEESGEETSEHSEDNSDSSASFEFNQDVRKTEPEVPNRNRNLGILDELEEEELSTPDSSDNDEDFQDAENSDSRKLSLNLASSGSGSSPDDIEFSDPSVTIPQVQVLDSVNSTPVDSHTVDPLLSSDKVQIEDSKLTLSPYLHTEIVGQDTRSIVKRHRNYPGSGETYPELGFFNDPEREDTGTQTIRSFRQPQKCTIDPERYFRPFKVESTHFDVRTEFSNGDVEIRSYSDTGVQIRFDPLWDKHEQQLVLSPSATPPRGSPVTVEKEGKIQPKELVFQWPDKDNDSVFADNLSFSDNKSLNLAGIDASRRRRPSSERRGSCDVIDESEEDLLEESASILDAPPKGAFNKGRKPDSPLRVPSPLSRSPPIIEEKLPGTEPKMETGFGNNVVEFTSISCKGFDYPSPNVSDNEAQIKSVRQLQTETKPEMKAKANNEQESSDSEAETAREPHRSPPKRRHKRTKPPGSPHNSPSKRNSRNSSSDEEIIIQSLERVHIIDSSDADDESDEEARVPLFHKSASPLPSPGEPKWVAPSDKWVAPTDKWVAPTDAFIEPISVRQSPRNSPQLKSESPRISISPRPRPVAQPRVKTSDFISSSRISPVETKPVLYNQFSRPKSPGSQIQTLEIKPEKKSPTDRKVFETTPAPRVQSAINIQLSGTSKPAPIPKYGAKIEGPKTRPTTLNTTPKVDDDKIYAKVPAEPKKYTSALMEPINTENRNISHLFTLPDKTIQPEREKIMTARHDYMKTQQETNNEEERKKILSRLLGTRDWSEREMPKPKSILKKPSPSFETKVDDLPLGYRPTSLDTPNLAKICKSTENIKDRISRVVERHKEEDRERSRSRSNSRGSEFERGRPERRSMTLPAHSTRAKSLDSLLDSKSMSLPRSDSKGNLHRSPSICLNKEAISFFSDRKSYTNLLETDIDNEQQNAVPLIRETDLDSVSKSLSTQGIYRERSKSETREVGRPVVKKVYDDRLEKTKSMELLTDNTTIEMSAFGGTPEVVPVTKESTRLSKSLGQLDLPDWYVNAPRKVEDVDFGLSCTKTPPSSSSTSFDHSKSFRSTNTSFDAVSPRSTILTTRVSPPRRTPSPKPLKNFELPSEKFRRTYVPMASKKIVSKMRLPGSKSEDNLTTKGLVAVDISLDEPRKSEILSPFSFSKEKEIPKPQPEVQKITKTAVVKTETVAPIPEFSRPKLEIKPEPEMKKMEVTKVETEPLKPEGRFKSSATLQLKPATPPKPLVRPPPPPKPEARITTVVKSEPKTLFGKEIVPFGAPPPVPQSPEEVKPKVEELPKFEEPKVSIFDLPFADDESPPEEENRNDLINLESPISPQPEKTTPQRWAPNIPRRTSSPKESEISMQVPQFRIAPKSAQHHMEAPRIAPKIAPPPKIQPPRTEMIVEAPKLRQAPVQTEVLMEPPKPSFSMEAPENELVMEAPKTFVIQAPRPAEAQIQPPSRTTFNRPSTNPFVSTNPFKVETTFDTEPKNSTFEIEPKNSTFDLETKPKETTLDAEPSETRLRLQAPSVQAACQPLTSKNFTTTPSQFYALNCIDTDFDTSATASPPMIRSPLNNSGMRSDEISSDSSAKESQPLERKWAPQEANVGVQFRRNDSNRPAPIETSIDGPISPRSPRVLDEPTPRSPRETSFVSKPSPKFDSTPSSPRETSFLSKGKERSHFVFPKPAQKETSFGQRETPKETTFGPQETSVDGPYQASRRPNDFRTPQVPDYRNQQPIRSTNGDYRAQYQTPKPLATYQRPQVHAALETSIDASPMIKRNERHPPTRIEPSPIQNHGRPLSAESQDQGWKTSTPITRVQNYPRNRLPSRETSIDTGPIVQQPKSAPGQFERTLDNDSFRFNAPQSESTPLNMSLESNSSIRGQLRSNQVPRPVETEIDGDLRGLPRKKIPPAPPIRKSSVDRAPQLRGGNPRSTETDIDSDLGRDQHFRPLYQNGPRTNGPRNSQSSYSTSRQNSVNSRPGSVTSHASDGYFDPGDLETFKRLAREDPLVSTSSPRASPLDANFNAFGQPIFPNSFGMSSNVRIDHSKNIYQPRNSVPESPSDPESPHNSSLVEVLDGLLGKDNSPPQNISEDFSDPHKKRTISEAKFDIFNDISKKLNEDVVSIKCRNSKCGKTLPMRQARTVYVSCSICYCYYCSEECRSKHYPKHEQRCTLSRVENSCKLVARRLKTDKTLSHQLSSIARNAYHSQGRGCVAVTLESPLQCDQVLNATRTALQSQPVYCTMSDLDSDPKISDNAMDFVVDYNPNTDYVINVCCKVNRRMTEYVRYCEIGQLTVIQMPQISVNDKQPREQWFYSIQDKLRERGVDLKRQYPDVYNQIIQYVDRKLPFQSITIYPVDGNTGRTFLCSISPDLPVDIRAMTWNKPQLGRPQGQPQGQRTPLGAPVGVSRVTPKSRPMYQPPRRATNIASKETEL